MRIERELKKVWDNLQAKKSHLRDYLDEIHLSGIRGIDDLRVRFDYPVSVISGINCSGKSTLLFAAACAYKVPGAGIKDFVPSSLFPDYRPNKGNHQDRRDIVTLSFEYTTPTGRRSMRWQRRKGWNRSFFGRKGAKQPERPIYLRTLTNLSNPSEVRGVLQMSRLATPPQEYHLTASQIRFAQQLLPFPYDNVVNLTNGRQSLLFAQHKSGSGYSELQMAAGERAILRLSQEIAQLSGALVLIDEVEAGLHPWVQQLLMLHLQNLALRNDLQVIVTSHSPVVIDSVPLSGRIVLERKGGNVVQLYPYRDIIQNALYGRSRDKLNLLCEDEAAKAVLNGVLDDLVPSLDIQRESVCVGCNTGASEFPTHVAAFHKFGLLDNVIFVLDGDQRNSDIEQKMLNQTGREKISVLYLPGDREPEAWVWDVLGAKDPCLVESIHVEPDSLAKEMERIDTVYSQPVSGPRADVTKAKLEELAEWCSDESTRICRSVSRHEARNKASEIQPLVEELSDALTRWRNES